MVNLLSKLQHIGVMFQGSSDRGKKTKKAITLPNLAAAGVREVRSDTAPNERSRNTYIANRGKRRSNDRNSFSRPKKKPIYIEQQGIFSEGLNDGGKNLRAKTITSDGIFITRIDRENKADDDGQRINSSCDALTYGGDWLEDNADDRETLEGLLADVFISDLQPGTVMPDVLPTCDEIHFQPLKYKDIKKEEVELENTAISVDSSFRGNCLRSDNEAGPSNCLNGNVATLVNDKDYVQISSFSSSVADTELKNFCQGMDSELCVFQLPSSINSFSRFFNGENKCTVNMELSSTQDEPCSNEMHCLERFPNGACIGKIRIRKSGRTELEVCGVPFDIDCGSYSESQNQSLLFIETNELETKNMISKIEPTSTDEKLLNGKAHMIGTISKTFICSHSLPQLLQNDTAQREIKKYESHHIENFDDKGDEEMRNLLTELKIIIKKEQLWSNWISNYK
ncbi:unnamed protein product [Dracunculus medinensis]|uniref:Ovule protein n=1 Tax=Dracunculus medinensis TaxID=318479 RepID=A0A0N4ULD9_DRAME|nr:unnamed protein product [Dracunculus medinensis]